MTMMNIVQILLSVATMTAMTATAASASSSPLVRFDFPCHGKRVANNFADTPGSKDSLLGSLRTGNETNDYHNIFQCSQMGTGIIPSQYLAPPTNTQQYLVSEKSMKDVLPNFHHGGNITLDLWFTTPPPLEVPLHDPEHNKDFYAPIVSISALNPIDKYLSDPECGDLEHNFQVLQWSSGDGRLMVQYRADSGCAIKFILPQHYNFTAGAMTHLMLTAGHNETRFYINGQRYLKGQISQPTFDVGNLNDNWNPQMHLQFFADHGEDFFRGSVHRFAIYNTSIDDPKAHYEKGLLELEHLAKPRFATGTHNDKMIPTNVPGLPTTLEPRFDTDLKLFQGNLVTTTLDLKGISNLSPNDAVVDGWWTLQAKLVSVPTHGLLLPTTPTANANDTTMIPALQANDTLDLIWSPADNAYKVTVNYTLSDDPSYFNVPQFGNTTTRELESFSYRIIVVEAETGNHLAWSSALEPKIKIQHVNKQPTLDVSEAYFIRPESEEAQLEGNITFDLREEDESVQDLNQVVVHIKTVHGGILYLNLTSNEIPGFCQNNPGDWKEGEESVWQCSQDGNKGEKHLTFLAYPSQIPNLLLQELRFVGNEADNVTIQIFLGEGKQCMPRAWHRGNDEIYGDQYCYTTTVIIPVDKPTPENIVSAATVAPAANIKKVRGYVVWKIIAGCFAGVGVVVMICCIRHRDRRNRAKAGEAPVDADQDQDKDGSTSGDDSTLTVANIQGSEEEDVDLESQSS